MNITNISSMMYRVVSANCQIMINFISACAYTCWYKLQNTQKRYGNGNQSIEWKICFKYRNESPWMKNWGLLFHFLFLFFFVWDIIMKNEFMSVDLASLYAFQKKAAINSAEDRKSPKKSIYLGQQGWIRILATMLMRCSLPTSRIMSIRKQRRSWNYVWCKKWMKIIQFQIERKK